MRCRVVIFVLCGALWIGRAVAEDAVPFAHNPIEDLVVPEVEPDDVEEFSEALAEQALSNLNGGAVETAARQLEVSYIMFSRRDLLLPMARAMAELGYHQAAVERAERFLQDASEIDGEARQAAETIIRESRGHFAAVHIDSEPQGARILIDGRYQSDTPSSHVLSRGEYRLRLHLEGYQDFGEQLVVQGGAPMELMYNLEPLLQVEGPSRTLTIALWSTVGVASASAVMLVVTHAVAGMRWTEAEEAAGDYTDDYRTNVYIWRNSAVAMAIVTTSIASAAVALAVHVAGQRRRVRGD